MERIKKITAFLLAVLVIFCCAGCGSDTDRSLDDVLEKKLLRVGVDTTLTPVAFTDDEGNICGIAPDIAKELAGRLDAALEIKTVYVNEAVDALNTGKIDCFIGYPDVDFQTELLISSIDMLLERNIVVIVPDRSKAKRLYDLKDTTFGAVLRTDALAALTNATELRSSLKDVKTFKDARSVLDAMDKSQLQAAVFEEAYILYLSQIEPNKYRIIDQKLTRGEYSILFKKDADGLRRSIDRLYSLLNSTGLLEEIFDRWIGAIEPEKPDEEPLLTESESDLIFGADKGSEVTVSDISQSDA